MYDFFEKIARGDYSRPEIKWALAQVPDKDLLRYFDYFFECQLASDPNIRRYAQELALRIPATKLVSEIRKLMDKQKSGEPETINLSRALTLQIPAEDLLLQLEFLLDCQKEQDANVVNLSLELALSIPRNLLSLKLPQLIACQSSGYVKVQNMTATLALKVMHIWNPVRLESQLEFLIACQDLTDQKVRAQARELAMHISVEKMYDRLQQISLKLAGGQARSLVQDLIAKIEDARVGIRPGKVLEIVTLINSA